ncbi:hypothetical protein [Myceligenerans pegani]|uniref:Secreted protein n=1 Tax=Myceligenerans pegani TaxID=2776917 RepID=A0ABR9N5L2_9MICO|nr:hypothetical protein [Myceligenerans sp. TRM 65318]MBE1878954.1 hypothetical protein [Myceligenerans sp. TRM 65318]MBE3021225.1 hypothetical protein [Myceligenerans sp. TRM 65318]
MRRTVLLRTVPALGAAALLLVGCAQAGSVGVSATSEAAGVPSAGGDEPEYLCQGTIVPGAVLSDGATADQLGDKAAAALDTPDARDVDPREWRILTETSTEVYLVRELPAPREHDDGEVRTHEVIGFEWMDETEWGGEGWQLMRAGDCALRYDMGGLGDAIVALDPGAPPDPAAMTIDLLVTEVACASGEPADGRIEVDHLAELEDRIEIVIGVRPQSGGQNCPSNPPTPFTLELDAPLGDRTIVDLAVHPAREVTVRSAESRG